jgi:hypothetical protein
MKLARFDLRRGLDALGSTGVAAAVLLTAALAFATLVVQPLEAKSRSVAERLARLPAGAPADGAPEQLGAFYQYLSKPEQTTDWLAKLYAIGAATGVELRSASYRSEHAGRIERYQILLPLSGSYAQMREFLDRALAEIPVLSLDQMTLKRGNRNEGAVQAELRLTLHQVAQQDERQVKP